MGLNSLLVGGSYYIFFNSTHGAASHPHDLCGGTHLHAAFLEIGTPRKTIHGYVRKDSGNSYLNVNSNTKEFQAIVEAARGYMRNILSIPNDYQIWFLGGGCHLQFAGLPLNFLGDNPSATANYTTTGYFSKLAFSEANRYCRAKSICPLTADS